METMMGIGAVYLFVLVLGLFLVPVWLGAWMLLRWLNGRQATTEPSPRLMGSQGSPSSPLTQAERERVFSPEAIEGAMERIKGRG